MNTRILQLFNQYRERGGEEKSALRIFRHASEIYEMDRLWWDSRSWDREEGPGKLGQLQRLFYNHDSARELKEKVADFKPDILMCHNLYPVGSPSIYRVASQLELPVIQYVHNFRPFSVGGSLWNGTRVATESLKGNYCSEIWNGSWQDSRARSAIFAAVLKGLHGSGWLSSVKRWVCISDFMRKQFIEAGLSSEQVVSLRHSWDTQDLSDEPIDKGYYLFLSRLVPEKGVHILLDAWDVLARQLGQATPRLKIGGVGTMADEIERRARDNSYIEALGFLDGAEKADLIAGCRAMLAPSIWWEPLGLVTYEAYESGKPMIAAASGGLIETVQDGLTGFLFQPGSVSGLVAAVRKLEEQKPNERLAMGIAGRDWLLKETSPLRWQSKFQEIIESVRH